MTEKTLEQPEISAGMPCSTVRALPPYPVYHRPLLDSEKDVLRIITDCPKGMFGWTQSGTTDHEIAERLRILGLIEFIANSATGKFWRALYSAN